MSNECYQLTGTDGGNIPTDYPLQLDAICKPVNGRLPRNVWNEAEKNWVALLWTPCPDPTKAVSA